MLLPYPMSSELWHACAQGSVAPPAIAALTKLVSLFGLSFIAREAGDFLEDGYVNGEQV